MVNNIQRICFLITNIIYTLLNVATEYTITGIRNYIYFTGLTIN